MNSTTPDQPAGPDPEDFEIDGTGTVREIGDDSTYDGHPTPQPGAPTADELAADTNLFPEGTPDIVRDGTEVADLDNLPAAAEESGDHEHGDA